MTLEFTIVDSFTDRPFSGNPAGVCILNGPMTESRMQQVAAEINLSETAFLHPENAGYRLRWFTPKAEVKLCGHATLASAHVLWERNITQSNEIEFYTLSGKLVASRQDGSINLNFPVEPVTEIDIPDGMIEALGAVPVFMGDTGVRYFAELSSAEEVRRLRPDLSGLCKFPPGRLIVTARSDDPQYDFISRYFAPGIGVPEDPVTGSAHCALAVYWAEKLGKAEFNAYQASERGGSLRILLDDNRVNLLGSAVTVMRGTFSVEL